MASSDSKMTLKLLIDAGNNKVLFAEAGKDFIDFMFSLLLLPLGSIIKLLAPRTALGSIGKLYQSVENINETYLVPNLNKSTLLQPTVSALAGASPLRLTGTVTTPQPTVSALAGAFPLIKYTSVQSSSCVGDSVCLNSTASQILRIRKQKQKKYAAITGYDGGQPVRAPCCLRTNTFPLHLPGTVGPENGGGGVEAGFVKGVVTYMITDDLEVTPMSAISSITRINRFSVKKDVRLEEKTVVVGMDQGLALLSASLMSVTALTNVFLNSSK